MRTNPAEHNGFTLLEVMAAFVIAALATVVFLQAGFAGAAQNRVAGTYQEATARAQSRLASFGVLTQLQAENLAGDDGGGYSWRVAVTPLRNLASLTLYQITLTEIYGKRSVTLITDRLATTR
jgi:general secretion pathway protein I